MKAEDITAAFSEFQVLMFVYEISLSRNLCEKNRLGKGAMLAWVIVEPNLVGRPRVQDSFTLRKRPRLIFLCQGRYVMDIVDHG